MAPQKKLPQIPPYDSTLVLDVLRSRWFELAPKEDYPNTPTITKELDRIEVEIKKLQKS